jgi:signal transduction histidine kinase
MTLGTSPHPLGAALDESAGAEARAHATRVRTILGAATAGCHELATRAIGIAKEHRTPILRVLAGGYLLALVAVLASSWGIAGLGETLHMGQVHVAFLMLAGAGMAVASLGTDKLFPVTAPIEPEAPRDLTGLGDLLAQMSHELRTPLNAVIGFSEVMRHELHGPLNERYQEYAIHISESGGRMLKSSQDALAVAEAMTVLLAKTPHLPQESVSAVALLEEAWRSVGGTGMDASGCGPTCTMRVERRAATQALEHILREALNRAEGPASIEAVALPQGNVQRLKIRARLPIANTGVVQVGGTSAYPLPGTGGLNILLARLLIEAQGGQLTCGLEADGAWCAEIGFKSAA